MSTKIFSLNEILSVSNQIHVNWWFKQAKHKKHPRNVLRNAVSPNLKDMTEIWYDVMVFDCFSLFFNVFWSCVCYVSHLASSASSLQLVAGFATFGGEAGGCLVVTGESKWEIPEVKKLGLPDHGGLDLSDLHFFWNWKDSNFGKKNHEAPRVLDIYTLYTMDAGLPDMSWCFHVVICLRPKRPLNLF